MVQSHPLDTLAHQVDKKKSIKTDPIVSQNTLNLDLLKDDVNKFADI